MREVHFLVHYYERDEAGQDAISFSLPPSCKLGNTELHKLMKSIRDDYVYSSSYGYVRPVETDSGTWYEVCNIDTKEDFVDEIADRFAAETGGIYHWCGIINALII